MFSWRSRFYFVQAKLRKNGTRGRGRGRKLKSVPVLNVQTDILHLLNVVQTKREREREKSCHLFHSSSWQ